MGRFKRLIAKVVVSSLLVTTVFSQSGVLTTAAATTASETNGNRIIVKYRDKSKADLVKSITINKLNLSKLSLKKQFNKGNLELLEIDNNTDISVVLNELKNNSEVEFAQEDYQVKLASTPNDTSYNEQWALKNIGQVINGITGTLNTDISAETAWEITKGDSSVVVAVLDTDLDISHEDLSQNIWDNSAEIKNNGIDDDNNGYVDDVLGYDFANKLNTVYSSANEQSHATHLAGIIAAVSDNSKGISGIAPGVKIMPLKFVNDGIGYTSDAIEGIQYAEANGATIVNCSWWTSGDNIALKDAISSTNMLFVTAAGNSGTNNDISPIYPANFNLSNVISVSAMDNQGKLSSFSNYGLNTVDIAAPGKDIISTTPGNGYGYLSGTSMSAAYASGVAALVKSKNPAMTASQIKEQIKATATSSSNISDKIQNGRVLNAYYALGDQQTLTGETSPTENVTNNTPNSNEPPQDPEQYATWKQNLSNTANSDSQALMLGYSNGKMYNDYIEYVVASNGRFTIGTTGGNPENAYDNYKRMLYGHPSPGTSFTTLKVDGSNYHFSPQSVNQDSSNLSTTAKQNINGVNIDQELKIVQNSNTGKADTVQIKYTATNQGTSSHTVGTRIMMDTMLGNNDAAPFRIPGYGAVTTEFELTGSNIPDYWQAFDSLTNPSVIAQGTLLRSENRPDKVQFTNWGSVYNTMWDYTIRPGSANGDSAVSVYWNPLTLQPGESKTYVTYYGLSEFMQDLSGNIGLTLNRIPSIEATTSGYYPNPIAVTGYIINNGSAMLNNVKAKITLPSGMRVYDDQIELSIGSIGVGTTRDFAWNVVLPEFQTETTLNYTVEVSADNTDTKSLSYSFTVPATKVSSEALRYYEGAKYSIGAYNILTGQSTAIVDPVDAATGNFIQNNTDISVSGYNPISFNKFYNSVDNWSGSLGRNWHNNYEIKLSKLSDDKVLIKFDDGRIEEYTKDQSGIYQPMLGKYGVVHFIDGQGYTLTQKDKTKYSFDLAGSLKEIQDIAGNITYLTYDSAKLASVYNDCGSLQFQYSGDLLSKITDNTGRTVEYSYTAGNLTSFKDVDGNQSTFVYDENNRLTVIIDPAGNAKVTNVYDERNRVIKQTMADGTVNTMSYDDTNKTTTLTDRNGAQTIYKWDDKFRIYETVYINGNEKAVFNNLSQKTAFTDKNGNTYYYEYDINGNITKKTNPFGEITEYTYDSNNHVTSIKKPDGSIYIYNYDANGNMTVAKDPLGRELKIEYNAKALPVKINLPDGSFSEVQYDERGNATVVKDPLGNASTFIYDTSNRVISITKPEGNKVEFEYTPKGKVKKTTFPDGTFITATYDVRGLVSEETDPNGGITKYNYNSMGKLIEKIDPAGGVTKYEYDSMWNVSKVNLPDGSITTINYNLANQLESTKDAEGHVTILEHDALNNVTKMTDPKGGISQLSYDALSRLVQTVNANNAVTKFEYRYDGKISKVLDALNGATQYSYDPAGQLVSVKDALGNTSTYTYNALGLVVTAKNAKGAETKYEYNSNGIVTKVIKPDGTFDTLSYDKNGNLIKVVDAKGNTTVYSYDNMDRLAEIQNPIGSTKSVSYTKTGKVSTLTDENNNITTYKYDALDRLVEVVDAKGSKTKYSYDPVGNLTEVHRFGGITQETIDVMNLDKDSPAYQASSNELVTKYQYDRLGHVTQETNPASKVVVYSYDANGNLLSKTDRDGFVTKFEYDAVNNLKKTMYNDGKSVKYQYNPLNQVVGMTDWLGTNMFELDSLGRVLKATNYQNQVLEYKWSATGEKESIKYPDGSMVKYEYDLMGRLKKVNDAKNKTATYNYDALGNVVEKLLPNGYKTQYGYDELQSLKSMVNYDANGSLVDNYSYQYDAAGNMVKNDKNSKVSLYKYDGLNQLQEISKPDKTLEKNFYDTLGNRVRLETWKNGTYRYSADFKYDNLDRLIQVTGKGYNVLGNDEYMPQGINLQYDERGNIVKTSTNNTTIDQFTFDASNKLVQAINKKGEKSTFVYDGFGKRVGMTYDINPSKNIVAGLSYLNDITKPYDNVLTISGTNVDEINRQYTYGLEMVSVDTTKKKGSANRLYYLHDELGSPIKLMDEAGLVGAKFEYDEFGRPVKPNDVEKSGNVFSFTGYQLDKSTGLMYAQARYYMPEVGRFISEDSYKGEITQPQSLNWYVYCNSNPLTYIDPKGFDKALEDYFNQKKSCTPTITILVDQPTPKSREALGESVGHSFIRLDMGDGNIIYRGFYPGKDDQKAFLQGENMSGIVKDDFKHGWDVGRVYEINYSTSEAVRNFINTYDEYYNLYSNNCTDFAVDSLNKAITNVPIKEHEWQTPGFFKSALISIIFQVNAYKTIKGFSPADAGEDLRESGYYIEFGKTPWYGTYKVDEYQKNKLLGTFNSHQAVIRAR